MRFNIPEYFLKNGKLKPHQEEAIKNWFEADGRGIFNMATGAGKTVTALALLTRFIEKRQKVDKLIVVLTVPYKNLAEQWQKEAVAFGFTPIICYEKYAAWVARVDNAFHNLAFGINGSEILLRIGVNATFLGG